MLARVEDVSKEYQLGDQPVTALHHVNLSIEQGVFMMPVATKQCSISAAHSSADIDQTLEKLAHVLTRLSRR